MKPILALFLYRRIDGTQRLLIIEVEHINSLIVSDLTRRLTTNLRVEIGSVKFIGYSDSFVKFEEKEIDFVDSSNKL